MSDLIKGISASLSTLPFDRKTKAELTEYSNVIAASTTASNA